MPEYDYPSLEHRPTLSTPNEVLADELQTYKTPEQFASFMKYLQAAYGRTALAMTFAKESKRLTMARIYAGDSTVALASKEQVSIYTGALITAHTHTRTLSKHKRTSILWQNADAGLDQHEGEADNLYRSRLAARYLDLWEMTLQQREEIYENDHELAELIQRMGQRASGIPSLGIEQCTSVENGFIYGELVFQGRSNIYDYYFPAVDN